MTAYLGIEAKDPIAIRLENHFRAPSFQIDLLRREAWEYLAQLDIDNIAALESRMQSAVSYDDAFCFFRSKERLNNTRLIIQYLIRFCDGLPNEADIMEDIVNPFEQMREFTAYHIHQLSEADVVDAILREHEKLGLLKESNRWYYQGQIRKNHQEFQISLERAILPNSDGYKAMFTVLRNVSRFWFSVRREELKQCRRTDVFIYLFSVYLLKLSDKGR